MSTVVCLLQSIVYDQIEGKLLNGLMAATLKDFSCSENMKCSKYQFVFVTVEVVLSKPFLFLAEKTASPFRTLTLCVFVIVLPVFNLTHFDWLPANFRKAVAHN